MSEETKPSEAAQVPPPAPEIQQTPEEQQKARADLLRSLHVSDRISLGALGTAVMAGLIGIVQTGFMWTARNDEVEAALRAEQLRGCVAYQIAGLNLNARARWLSLDETRPMERDEDFGQLSVDYQNALVQLTYLLPAGNETAFDTAQNESMTAWGAYVERDTATLRSVSDPEGYWAAAHAELLEVCESVIRDVRDR